MWEIGKKSELICKKNRNIVEKIKDKRVEVVRLHKKRQNVKIYAEKLMKEVER